MKTLAVLALGIVLGTATAAAQPSWTQYIRTYLDYVVFDWPGVEGCARSGDQICRIAMAARQQRCPK